MTIVNSFIYANFDEYPLVWHLSTSESIREIEKIQKRCLRIVLDDYDVLLRKEWKSNNGNIAIKSPAIEIFQTVNNLNPNYMKDIITPKLYPNVKTNDILLKHYNTITYSTKSRKTIGPKI